MLSQLQDPKNKGSNNTFTETINTIKNSDKIENIYNYASTNTRDTIAYVLLALGILWYMFDGFYGGALVGVIFGLYFNTELYRIAASLEGFVNQQGLPRAIVLAGSTFLVFVAAPGLVIGAAVAVALKHLFITGGNEKA